MYLYANIGLHNRNNVNGITNRPKLGDEEKRKLINREREPKQKKLSNGQTNANSSK